MGILFFQLSLRLPASVKMAIKESGWSVKVVPE
jgi:hypothetical protein